MSAPAPEVDALVEALDRHGLALRALEARDGLPRPWWHRIEWRSSTGPTLSVPVDDEFSDASDEKQAMLLHLVLDMCACFEECEDYAEWAVEAAVDVDDDASRALYREYEQLVPQIRAVVGPDLEPISSWDFTMNAGAAQVLRAL